MKSNKCPSIIYAGLSFAVKNQLYSENENSLHEESFQVGNFEF